MLGRRRLGLVEVELLADQRQLAGQVVVVDDGLGNCRVVIEGGTGSQHLFLTVDPAHADVGVQDLQVGDRSQQGGLAVELHDFAAGDLFGIGAVDHERHAVGLVAGDVDADEGQAVDGTLRIHRLGRSGERARRRDDGSDCQGIGEVVELHVESPN